MALFGSLLTSALLSGCAGSRRSFEAGSAAAGEAPTIVTLRLRDGFIDIESNAAGITYSIFDVEGKTLAAGLTEDELKAKFPGHFEALEKALAESQTFDASLNVGEGSPRATGTEGTPVGPRGPLLHLEKDH
jgi:hypothetical protein